MNTDKVHDDVCDEPHHVSCDDGRVRRTWAGGERANDAPEIVWDHGEPTDPNAVISGTPGIYLLTACSVNASGEIIDQSVDGDGNYHGYLATPKWGSWEISAPVRLPDSLREQVRRQMGFGPIGLMWRRSDEYSSLRHIFGIHIETRSFVFTTKKMQPTEGELDGFVASSSSKKRG